MIRIDFGVSIRSSKRRYKYAVPVPFYAKTEVFKVNPDTTYDVAFDCR